MLRQGFGLGWWPSADARRAPPEALLRADNLIWDDLGIETLRPGSAILYGPLALLDVHSLHTAYIAGSRLRMAGVSDYVYVNGVGMPQQPFDGTGDIAMFCWLGKVFMARAGTKVKTDGVTITPWGITGPALPPIATSIGAFTNVFATCGQGEAPGFTAEEGTITAAYPAGADGGPSGAIEVVPNLATGRATINKAFTAITDFSTVGGYQGDNRDIFDMLSFITEPSKVETITIMVGVGPSVDPYADDYYYFDFKLGGDRPNVVDLPSLPVTEEEVRNQLNNWSDPHGNGVPPNPSGPDPNPLPSDPPSPTPANPGGENGVSATALISRPSFRRRELKNSAYNPGWTHLSCMRGQFNRVGLTPGRDWSTVKAIKIVYKGAVGATGAVRFDTLQMLGGVGTRALVGQYQFRYRWVKENNLFIAKSPESPASAEISLFGRGVQLSIPAAALAAKDPQADKAWIYMYGGTLPGYFRVHIADNLTSNGAGAASAYRIPRVPRPDGLLSSQDRRRLTTGAWAAPAAGGGTGALTIDITADEVTALLENESLEHDQRLLPNGIKAIAGPFLDRLLVLAQVTNQRGYLYISERFQPENFRWSRAFAVGDDSEVLYWMVNTTGGAYIGTSTDIWVLRGSGDDEPDDTIDLELKRMNINSPPVGPEVAAEGNSIVYRAKDGWRTFDGSGSVPVSRSAVEMLYRGQNRHGVLGVNTAGRFRAVIQNGVLTAVTPEGASSGSSPVLHRYDQVANRWHRHQYPANFRSLHREKDGTLLAGDDAGRIWQLDVGLQDNGVDIPVVVWPRVDDDDKPMQRKDAFDYQGRFDASSPVTVNLHLDGSETTSRVITAALPGLHKEEVSTLAPYRAAQLRITGSFNVFKLYEQSLAYRVRPMMRMRVDTGYVTTGRQDTDWIREIRVMVCSPVNLLVGVIQDDVLMVNETLIVAPNQTGIYTAPLGKGIRGHQPRITLSSTSPAGVGEVGFECYWIEFRYEPTGNVTEKNILRVSPEGVAL